MSVTFNDAVDRVGRAILSRQLPSPPDDWANSYPTVKDEAEKLVLALDALGLLKLASP